jgi:hypothetical protein
MPKLTVGASLTAATLMVVLLLPVSAPPLPVAPWSLAVTVRFTGLLLFVVGVKTMVDAANWGSCPSSPGRWFRRR